MGQKLEEARFESLSDSLSPQFKYFKPAQLKDTEDALKAQKRRSFNQPSMHVMIYDVNVERLQIKVAELEEKDTELQVKVTELEEKVNFLLQEEKTQKVPDFSWLMEDLKEKFFLLCQDNIDVNSAWINIDHIQKEIIILAITNELDFELERKIFKGPYKNLPVNLNSYFIEQRVVPLCGDKVEDIRPEKSKPIYQRTSSNA